MAVKLRSCTGGESLEKASVYIHTKDPKESNIHVFIFINMVWCYTVFNYMVM